MAYVAWLAQRTGRDYRLASEAEWEYAARAGTTTARFWGLRTDEACGHANAGDRTAETEVHDLIAYHDCTDGYVETAPVGSFSSNEYGLHDMLGNVAEWVEGCWNASYSWAPDDGAPWLVGNCRLRGVRGGGWDSAPPYLRSASRLRAPPDYRSSDIGLRVALTLAE